MEMNNNQLSEYNLLLTKDNIVRTESLGSVFLNYLKQKIFSTPQNIIIAIVGEPGTGKSIAGVKILLKMNPYLLMDRKPAVEILKERIAFTPERFTEILENGKLKKGDVIIFDEPQVTYNSRDFMSVTNKLLNKILTTYRYRQLITIFCTPNLNFIDSQARKVLTCVIEMKSVDIKNGVSYGKVYRYYSNNVYNMSYPIKLRFIDKNDGTLKEINGINFTRLEPEFEKAYRFLSENYKLNVQKEVKVKLVNEIRDIKDKPNLSLVEREIVKLKVNHNYSSDEIATHLGLPKRIIKKHIREMRKRGIVWGRAYLKELLSYYPDVSNSVDD